jgi:hypothetical protein
VTANLQKVFSLLKAHNPELCSVCSKRQHPCSKHSKSTSEAKPIHVLETPDKRGRARTRSEPGLEKKKPNPAPTTPAKDEKIDTNENLFQMLGILEEEYATLKDQYSGLVKQYEMVADSMTKDTIARENGSATLKAIGDDLTHCIQGMDTKVYYTKVARANQNLERYYVILYRDCPQASC